jgi:hypothetical protein
MVKTPAKPQKPAEKTPHSAATTTSAKHESPKRMKTAKIIVTAVKTSNNDEDLIAIKLGGRYTFNIKDVIKDICNNKGLQTHYGNGDAFKPFCNMKAAFDYDDTNKGTNKGWVMFIGDEVEADDDSKGKNFPKVAYKYFIKKLVNAIKHAESIEDDDIELAEDLIVTESEVDYYKDLFVGGNSSNGKLEELLAQEDPELESLF